MAVGLEYKQKDGNIPPFLTFLKYTDEKEKSAKVVSKILGNLSANQSLLDIGAGNGDYLLLILNYSDNPQGLNYLLLEPNTDLANILHTRTAEFPQASRIEVINKTWEDFMPDKKFDYILASHLYHIQPSTYEETFLKMVTCLSDGSKLIFILRDVDDVHEFKKTFKPILFDRGFTPKILDETIPIFEELARIHKLKLLRHQSISNLDIPINTNMEDTRSIVEFFLNMHWEDIPANIQNDALEFIRQKNGRFKQIDGILEVSKQ